ncbi:hypothetical protein ABID19_006595 [Mesorhizobium robiniae]|uniref:Uncharacterized protein n=1 Tax=Mesorhizobium robiniae TaxID=559315 RepID=A0ABV2GZ08_9HYPH
MQVDQPGVQLTGVQRRGQLVPEQSLRRETALKVASVNVAVKHLVALTQRILFGQGYETDSDTVCQPILQIGHIGAQKRDRLLRIREIEEPVSQRQVEQLFLPALDTASGTGRLYLDSLGWQFANGRGRGKW